MCPLPSFSTTDLSTRILERNGGQESQSARYLPAQKTSSSSTTGAVLKEPTNPTPGARALTPNVRVEASSKVQSSKSPSTRPPKHALTPSARVESSS